MTDENLEFVPDDIVESQPEVVQESELKQSVLLRRYIISLAIGVAVLCLFSGVSYWYILGLNQAPKHFPVSLPITIEQGTDVREITRLMQEKDVVQSDILLYYALLFFYEPKDIKASTYVFDEPLTTLQVAERLTKGDFVADLIRFTHYEGERVTQLAARAAKVLPQFDAETFITKAEPQEGKMFPETYFIPPSYTAEELQSLMLETFESNTARLQPTIEAQSLTLEEVIILASIIEREAGDLESKKMVSGILQNRIAIDMALQTDASMEYVLDKPLNELTPEDLKTDSPYNTYLNKGLPPTPIGNPGLDAITAVLEPTPSEYFYYITGNDGEFHYSKTYAEHLRNIQKYLR
ncbi:MAG: hypothetical protein RLZZ230_349 [Candidatus Parcubacteria bacterium]|jgi:UPF0755 protein